MDNKQIFAALEIADHEIRLIVGEFYNTRFNVIKVERVEVAGLSNLRIINEKAITEAIKKAVDNASNKIGAKVEKVLLSIPSVNAIRIPVKVNVKCDSIDNKITILDVKNAINKAMSTEIDEKLALINAICVKYTTNGITSRRMPLGEVSDDLNVHIDLLCADKAIAFEYAECVEKAGVEVIDISLDSFAIAKEACLFEQSVSQNVVVLKLERSTTTFALIKNGRFQNCEVIQKGFGEWVGKICDKFKLPVDVATRICKYNAKLDLDSCVDSPIYIWSNKGATSTITEIELCEEISSVCLEWVEMINNVCLPIIESGLTQIIITGEGTEIMGIEKYINNILKCSIKKYTPETLGVRSATLSSCLGLFYAYADLHLLLNPDINSLDMNGFNKTVQYKPLKNSTDNTLTNKLKTMLFDSKNN